MNLVPDTNNTILGQIRMGVDPLDLSHDGNLTAGTVPSGPDWGPVPSWAQGM